MLSWEYLRTGVRLPAPPLFDSPADGGVAHGKPFIYELNALSEGNSLTESKGNSSTSSGLKINRLSNSPVNSTIWF